MSDTLINALKVAVEHIEASPHGNDCFLDDGEYNRCFCMKDSVAAHLAEVLEAADSTSQDQQAAAKDAELPPLPVHKHTAWPHGWHSLYTAEQMAEYARAAIASMSAPAPAAEEKTDYVRVPKRPTKSMILAGQAANIHACFVGAIYCAMIAAAPSQGNGERLEGV